MACNNAAFTCGTLGGMTEMHESADRLYRAARLALRQDDVSQSELAKLFNTSSQTINNWEARGVSQQGAIEAEEVLGVSPRWILRGGASEPRLSTGSSTEVALPAHRAESAHEMNPDYVRFQLLDGAGGMGAGAENADYPEVVKDVFLAKWEVRRKLGFVPAEGRVRLITGRGRSMQPLINHGDVVMVDTDVTYFDGDAVYVINIGGQTQIKLLQMRGDGLHVVSTGEGYPSYRIEPDALFIGGKVVSVLGVREV